MVLILKQSVILVCLVNVFALALPMGNKRDTPMTAESHPMLASVFSTANNVKQIEFTNREFGPKMPNKHKTNLGIDNRNVGFPDVNHNTGVIKDIPQGRQFVTGGHFQKKPFTGNLPHLSPKIPVESDMNKQPSDMKKQSALDLTNAICAYCQQTQNATCMQMYCFRGTAVVPSIESLTREWNALRQTDIASNGMTMSRQPTNQIPPVMLPAVPGTGSSHATNNGGISVPGFVPLAEVTKPHVARVNSAGTPQSELLGNMMPIASPVFPTQIQPGTGMEPPIDIRPMLPMNPSGMEPIPAINTGPGSHDQMVTGIRAPLSSGTSQEGVMLPMDNQAPVNPIVFPGQPIEPSSLPVDIVPNFPVAPNLPFAGPNVHQAPQTPFENVVGGNPTGQVPSDIRNGVLIPVNPTGTQMNTVLQHRVDALPAATAQDMGTGHGHSSFGSAGNEPNVPPTGSVDPRAISFDNEFRMPNGQIPGNSNTMQPEPVALPGTNFQLNNVFEQPNGQGVGDIVVIGPQGQPMVVRNNNDPQSLQSVRAEALLPLEGIQFNNVLNTGEQVQSPGSPVGVPSARPFDTMNPSTGNNQPVLPVPAPNAANNDQETSSSLGDAQQSVVQVASAQNFFELKPHAHVPRGQIPVLSSNERALIEGQGQQEVFQQRGNAVAPNGFLLNDGGQPMQTFSEMNKKIRDMHVTEQERSTPLFIETPIQSVQSMLLPPMAGQNHGQGHNHGIPTTTMTPTTVTIATISPQRKAELNEFSKPFLTNLVL